MGQMRGVGAMPGNEHTCLISFLFQGSRMGDQSPEKIALVDSRSQQKICYGEFWSSVASSAAGMESIGITRGDTIMLVMANCVEFPIIFLAANSIGVVVTTANPLNTPGELRKQALDSAARFIFSSAELANKAASLGLPLVLVGDVDSSTPARFIPFSRLLQTRTTSFRSHAAETHSQLSSTAALLYSSGTTGLSKGVILSEGNLIAGVAIIEHARKEQLSRDEVVMGILPFFHIAGLVYEVLSSIYSRTTLVVAPRFELLEVFDSIQRFGVNYMPLVPPMVIAFTKNHLLSKRFDLSSLKYLVCGAAPLGKETHQAFLEMYPHVKSFPQAYGMTETTGVGFGLSRDSLCGSAGKLSPFCEAKVVDVGTGKLLPPFSQGELCIRGPPVMQGYFNNSKATSETIDEDGWLHTGDLVYLDNEGNMFVMDRLKELIKYKGFQVPPAELEALLLSHPLIKDCAVVPFPDEEAGEVPLAYVVLAANKTNVKEEDIIKFVSDQVAPHKRVRIVRFLDTIPKSATGKLLRRELIKLSRSKL